MYEPLQEPLGWAIDEEEEEEDQERRKGEEEPRDGGDGGGGERTVDTRGPVAPDRRCGGCGSTEERRGGCSPEFAKEALEKTHRSDEELEREREVKQGREEEERGTVAASMPPLRHL
jgi:hypothetical protein